ncbi:MAG TPA: nuclear transport factor 2 family protein [Planctomycetaceae bacterium]|jgi:uncharacterized protein (TIGR02246 family)
MAFRFLATSIAAFGLLLAAEAARAADSPDDPAIAAVRKSDEKLVAAFNAGKTDELVAMFLPKGELIDEAGTINQGPQEIKELFGSFFKQFPGAKLAINIESIRLVGPVAIDEGTRTMTTADGVEKSRFRYIAVWAKTDKGWQLASFRDFADDPPATPHDNLEPLAWLVGQWVNEGDDGRVAISYRWSEEQNYLLGEFEMKLADGSPRKSLQRIGWDPSLGKIRSWLFDADGGFAEGIWTVVDDGAVVKSSSVNPDGTTASATMTITSKDKDHFTIAGTDRVVGDKLDDDFEVTVSRRPPAAGK